MAPRADIASSCLHSVPPGAWQRGIHRWGQFLLLVVFAFSATAHAHKLRVITEQYPPFNYQEDGQAKGLAVEMAQLVLKDCGLTADIEFQPWNRAYATALKDPNVLLFTMSRRPEREGLFDWLFKVAPRQTWLMRLTDRTDIHLATLADAQQYRIAVGPIEDVDTQELVKAGFAVGKNLESVQDADWYGLNLRKLYQGQVDLMGGNRIGIVYTARKIGLDVGKLATALPLGAPGLGNWAVISRGSDPALVKKLKASAQKLEHQGAFKELLEKYSR